MRLLMKRILFFLIIEVLLDSQMLHTKAYPHKYDKTRSNFQSKPESRRGINIDLDIATKSSSRKIGLENELEKMLNEEKMKYIDETESVTPCATCSKLKKENKILKENSNSGVVHEIKSAFPCDDWDLKTQTCSLNRNIGDTVTFVIDFSHISTKRKPNVIWKQEFHVLHFKERKTFEIDPDDAPWNIVIGSSGLELRLSPITEMDIDFNCFSAMLLHDDDRGYHKMGKLIFKINAMPIDQGLLYPGAFLMLNMLTFVSLPQESMMFKWYMEKDGESGTLPSNMRISLIGSLLTVSELRKEQEGIITCSVYTNLGVFATKKRFLIKEINQDNNKLVFMLSRPVNHQQERRKKREIESDEYVDEISTEPDSFGLVKSKRSKYDETDNENDYSLNKLNKNFYSQKDDFPNSYEEDSQFNDKNSITQSFRRPQMMDKRKNNLYNSFNSQQRNNKVPQKALNGKAILRNEFQDVQNDLKISDGTYEDEKYNFDSVQRKNPTLEIENINANNNVDSASGISERLSYSKEEQIKNEHLSTVLPQEKEVLALSLEDESKGIHIDARDKLSMLISRCQNDFQCSLYAVCVKKSEKEYGFCRCLPRFEGNGIFCWEDYKVRS